VFLEILAAFSLCNVLVGGCSEEARMSVGFAGPKGRKNHTREEGARLPCFEDRERDGHNMAQKVIEERSIALIQIDGGSIKGRRLKLERNERIRFRHSKALVVAIKDVLANPVIAREGRESGIRCSRRSICGICLNGRERPCGDIVDEQLSFRLNINFIRRAVRPELSRVEPRCPKLRLVWIKGIVIYFMRISFNRDELWLR
jgi:hypothetical protein